jgi:hypothetical protein
MRTIAFNLIATFMTVISAVSCIQAAGNPEFIVLPSPENFSLLDQYEQQLSVRDKKQLGVDFAVQLINRDDLLGDQITHAIRCSFSGTIYFLLKDDRGQPAGTSPDVAVRSFRNCRSINDTMIVRDAAELLGLSSKHRTALTKGTLIYRIFQYNGDYFCRLLPGPPYVSGWCNGPFKAVARTTDKVDNAAMVMTTELKNKLITRIRSANDSYRVFFEYFNKSTGQQKAVPSWAVAEKGNNLICELSNPYKNTDELGESTRYLVRDLENLLIGKQFQVEYAAGQIQILPK